MKIVIGYPPLESKKGVPLLSQNRQFQYFSNPSYIFPVILASAASLLKRRGYDVIFKDAIAEKLTEKDFNIFLERERPDIFAFETKTPVIKEHWQWINRIKQKFPNLKIVIMGDHITALPKETMENCSVDFVLTGGDYDFMLSGLVDFSEEKDNLPAGFWYRKNGEIKNSGQFQLNRNLNELPFIDRELTKNCLYNTEYNIKGHPFAYIMSGRDCPWHKCRFCSWTTLFPTFRVRSPKNVLDEIGDLINRYKVKEIFDDTGTFPPGKWLEEFCQGMITRGYNKKISFSCNLRVDYLNQENAPLMKKAGFRLLKVGLESGNQKTLDRINKGIKVEQIKNACRIARQNKLEIHLTMIVGYPWETRQEALNTFNLAKELMLSGEADILQSTIIIPYPGTPLFKEALENNWFRFGPDDYGRYDMSEPVLKTIDMGPEEVIKICERIYKIFISPRYVWAHFFKLRNWNDIKYHLRGIKAVFGHLKDFNN